MEIEELGRERSQRDRGAEGEHARHDQAPLSAPLLLVLVLALFPMPLLALCKPVHDLARTVGISNVDDVVVGTRFGISRGGGGGGGGAALCRQDRWLRKPYDGLR